MLEFHPLTPWTIRKRQHVLAVAADMAAMDHKEIFGLRPEWQGAEELVSDIGNIIIAGALLEGFVAVREVEGDEISVAVALAFRTNMPNVADLAFFGRAGHRRVMPQAYGELLRRSKGFGGTHKITLAQVPVLADHTAARKRLARLGGVETFDYGPIGHDQQSYIHTIWRF